MTWSSPVPHRLILHLFDTQLHFSHVVHLYRDVGEDISESIGFLSEGLSRGERVVLGSVAGKSILNRLELTPTNATAKSSYRKVVLSPEFVNDLLADVFLEAHPEIPNEIILDVDATDDPLHGNQE